MLLFLLFRIEYCNLFISPAVIRTRRFIVYMVICNKVCKIKIIQEFIFILVISDDIVKVAAHKESMKKVHSSHGKLVRKVKDVYILPECNSENKPTEYKHSAERKENKYEVNIAKSDLINITLSECIDSFEGKPEKIVVHSDHDYSRLHRWEPVKSFYQKIGPIVPKHEVNEREFMPSIDAHLVNIKTLGIPGEIVSPAQCIVTDSHFEIVSGNILLSKI